MERRAINAPNLALNCIHHKILPVCEIGSQQRQQFSQEQLCTPGQSHLYSTRYIQSTCESPFQGAFNEQVMEVPRFGPRKVGGWQLFWTPMPWPLSNIPLLNQSFEVLRDCRSTCKRTVHMFFFFFSRPAATLGGCGCHVCFSLWWNYLLIVLSLVTFMIRFSFFPSLRWCIWM